MYGTCEIQNRNFNFIIYYFIDWLILAEKIRNSVYKNNAELIRNSVSKNNAEFRGIYNTEFRGIKFTSV